LLISGVALPAKYFTRFVQRGSGRNRTEIAFQLPNRHGLLAAYLNYESGAAAGSQAKTGLATDKIPGRKGFRPGRGLPGKPFGIQTVQVRHVLALCCFKIFKHLFSQRQRLVRQLVRLCAKLSNNRLLASDMQLAFAHVALDHRNLGFTRPHRYTVTGLSCRRRKKRLPAWSITDMALVGFRGGEARTGQLGCEHLVRERERA